MIVFTWDEVMMQVTEWIQKDPPEELSDRDLLFLADARITVEIGEDQPTRNHKMRQSCGVLILDATLGPRDHIVRTYICKDDPDQARKVAEQELQDWRDSV
jgi:hypothetical protein